jgi:hypothetical protein
MTKAENKFMDSGNARDEAAARAASLLDTLERIRADRFQHIDANIVRDVLRLHSDPAAAPGDLSRGLEQIIDRYFSVES